MRPLRILHISDLHERAPFERMPPERQFKIDWDERQRGQVLGARFSKALQALSEGGIDIVCLTGDVADWGHPAEYAKATTHLDAILRTVEVPRDRFFAVPGNHDVQRSVEAETWAGIRRWLAETHDGPRLGRWFLGVQGPPPGTEAAWREQLLARTGAFWAWYADFRGDPAERRTIPLGYCETLAVGSIPGTQTAVHVVGLDSAWLCGGDDDQGAILVTQEQVEAHVRKGKQGLDGFRIGLVHHPLDHLADHHAVRRLLGDDGVDLLLHGHQHAPLAFVADEPGSPLRILAASCLMEGDLGKGWPNGFQVIEVDADSRSGAVHFHKWSADGRFWARGSDIYRDAPDGTLRWIGAPLDRAFPAQEDADLSTGRPAPAGESARENHVVRRMEGDRLVDTSNTASRENSHSRNVWIRLAFWFGVVFVIAILILAVAIPTPTAFQYLVFRIVLALAAAGVASTIPGFIELKINPGAKFLIHAGGALAVFAIVYFQSPAKLVSNPPEPLWPASNAGKSEDRPEAPQSLAAKASLGNVDEFQNGTYIINFAPSKRYRVARLTNPGNTPIGISLIGFPEQYFYTDLAHQASTVGAGQDRDFGLIVLPVLPDRTEYPFTITTIPLDANHGDHLRVSIRLQGDWRGYLQDELKRFAQKVTRIDTPTPEQLYLAAQETLAEEYETLSPGLKKALIGRFLVSAQQPEAAALAYAKAVDTVPRVVHLLLAQASEPVRVAYDDLNKSYPPPDAAEASVTLTFDPHKSTNQVGERTKVLVSLKVNGVPQVGKPVTFRAVAPGAWTGIYRS